MDHIAKKTVNLTNSLATIMTSNVQILNGVGSELYSQYLSQQRHATPDKARNLLKIQYTKDYLYK